MFPRKRNIPNCVLAHRRPASLVVCPMRGETEGGAIDTNGRQPKWAPGPRSPGGPKCAELRQSAKRTWELVGALTEI